MTPMMKRLCEAAKEGSNELGFQMFEDVQISVVTAILNELKDMDEETITAMKIHNPLYSSDRERGKLKAAVDHILSDPKAANTQDQPR